MNYHNNYSINYETQCVFSLQFDSCFHENKAPDNRTRVRARERLCAPDGAGSGRVVHHPHFSERTSGLIRGGRSGGRAEGRRDIPVARPLGRGKRPSQAHAARVTQE